jgi:hypothetical protein
VREWTSTLPRELPFWELESWRTSKFSESNYMCQNSLSWKFPYIIGKLLKRRCLKWACMTHWSTWNKSYGQKKGRKSNWQIDSQLVKVRNCLDFLVCKWCATYHWKVLDKGYNFSLDVTLIESMHTKLCASKVTGVSILKISGLPLGSLGTKWHLGASPVVRHKKCYKGEGGGFPQVRVVVSLVSLWLPVACLCTKSVLIMH